MQDFRFEDHLILALKGLIDGIDLLKVGLERLYQRYQLLLFSMTNRSCFPPLLSLLIEIGNIIIEKFLIPLAHPIVIVW